MNLLQPREYSLWLHPTKEQDLVRSKVVGEFDMYIL